MHDGWSNPSGQPLPEWIQTLYEILEARMIGREPGMARDQAAELLLTEAPDELTLKPADADYGIQRLLERGYLYEVDGELFVTEPDTEC